MTRAPSKREKVLTALEAIGGQGTAAEIAQATQEEFGPQHHVPSAKVSYFLVREDSVQVDQDGPDAAIFHLNGDVDQANDVDEDPHDVDQADEGDEGGEDEGDLPPLPEDVKDELNSSSHMATVLRAAIDVDERGSTIATKAIRDRCADEWTKAPETRVESRTSTCIHELRDKGILEDAGRGSWRLRPADELDENDDVDDVPEDRGGDQEETDDVEQLDQNREDDVDAEGRPPAPRPITTGGGLTERELELLEDAIRPRIHSEYMNPSNAERDAWLWVRVRQLLGWGPP